MEKLNGLLNTFSVVPAEWFEQLNDTQKIVFLSQSGMAIVLAIVCVYLIHTLRRVQSVPNIEKEQLELDEKVGADWHDCLVSRINAGGLTRKQYKMYVRLIKLVCPGWLYTGTLGPASIAAIRVATVKDRIQKNFQNGSLNPTAGWLEHLRRTQDLMEKSNGSNSKFMQHNK